MCGLGHRCHSSPVLLVFGGSALKYLPPGRTGFQLGEELAASGYVVAVMPLNTFGVQGA
jgi:hypothetical protein